MYRNLIVIILLFFLADYTLFNLQIENYKLYKRLSERNCIRFIPLYGKRGRILDAKGRLLAEDKEVYNLAVNSSELSRESLNFLSKTLKISIKEIKDLIKKNYNYFFPTILKRNLSKKEIFLFKMNEKFYPEITVLKTFKRRYNFRKIFSHVLGYTVNLTPIKKQIFKKYGLDIPKREGAKGIEKIFDEYLRPENGIIEIKVDSKLKIIEILAIKKPKKGKDIQLTLDAEFQKVAFSALKNFKGVIIFGDIKGKIISLVSKPSFDIQRFVDKDNEYIKKIMQSKNAPLLNRATQGVYPPGSIFKLVLSVGALQENLISINDKFFCSGEFKYGNRIFKCWSEHGYQNIISAIKNSCNVYFYNLGLKMGKKNILKYADLLGFSQKTGIELEEKKGYLPSGDLSETNVLNISIGQGKILVTPIQVFKLMCFIANKGNLVKPYLIKRIGEIEFKPELKPLGIKEKNLEIIKMGMRRAVQDGTAQILSKLKLNICAKTGTAQNPKKPHSWVAGFFPYKKPKYVFVVLLEHGGSSINACKIAFRFLKGLKEKGLIR